MIRTRVLVRPQLKAMIIASARLNQSSVTTEVALALLAAYRPAGWRELSRTIEAVSQPDRGTGAKMSDDVTLEALLFYIPDGLRSKIQESAAREMRSFSAEVRMALERIYR